MAGIFSAKKVQTAARNVPRCSVSTANATRHLLFVSYPQQRHVGVEAQLETPRGLQEHSAMLRSNGLDNKGTGVHGFSPYPQISFGRHWPSAKTLPPPAATSVSYCFVPTTVITKGMTGHSESVCAQQEMSGWATECLLSVPFRGPVLQ